MLGFVEDVKHVGGKNRRVYAAAVVTEYYIGLITNEEVIKELMETAVQIAALHQQRQTLGLSQEEIAFYDTLKRPKTIKDFYSNVQLVSLTRKLTEQLRKIRTTDWQQKESARDDMRHMVKRLLNTSTRRKPWRTW